MNAPGPVNTQPWPATSFRTQIVVSTVCLVAFAMVLLALGVQVVLAEVVNRDVDTVLHNRTDAVIGAIQPSPDPLGMEVQPSTLEPGVIVYSATGRTVAGNVSPALKDEADALRLTKKPRAIDVAETHRLLATPFSLPASETAQATSGVVVVTERLQPYEQSETYALLASLVLGLLVTAAAGLMARWVTHKALAPVAVMAARASDWSEHDLARRFELGEPNNEITALGSTLNQLLERVSMAIRAEQRLTAELAHELRTPLTSIQGAADLALLRGGLSPEARKDLEQVAASSRTMGNTITALLDLARGGSGSTGNSTSMLADVLRVVTDQQSGRLVGVDLAGNDRVRLAAPLDQAARALLPVVENAKRHARSTVMISCQVDVSHLDIFVDDDGPGLAQGASGDLFAPGTTGRDDGTGLGLGIARRTARSLGGDIMIADRPTGAPGARFVIRLPRV